VAWRPCQKDANGSSGTCASELMFTNKGMPKTAAVMHLPGPPKQQSRLARRLRPTAQKGLEVRLISGR